MGPMQEMPVFDSRVQVDPKVKDHWGIPVARLSGHRHQNDLLGTNFMSAKAEAWLKEAGAATVIRSAPSRSTARAVANIRLARAAWGMIPKRPLSTSIAACTTSTTCTSSMAAFIPTTADAIRC
jgi:hypothetical protein